MHSFEPVGPNQHRAVPGKPPVERLKEATLQTVLSPNPHSVRQARRFVSECLGDAADAEASEVAVLLTSELVTNAIQHGGPHSPSASVRLSVQDLAGRFRVEVEDASQDLPVLGDGAPSGVGGRDLLLVERLADRWGFERLAGGARAAWIEVATSLTATSTVGGDNG